MIVDEEIEGFIRYLDDVSIQLVCLLDIDGGCGGTCQVNKKTQLRLKSGNNQSQKQQSKKELNEFGKSTRREESSAIIKKIRSSNRRKTGYLKDKCTATSRSRAKRKGNSQIDEKNEQLDEAKIDIGDHREADGVPQQQEQQQQQQDKALNSMHLHGVQPNHQHYNQQSLLDSGSQAVAAELSASSVHTFSAVGQLTLTSLSDDITSHLDRGSSISPLNSTSIPFGGSPLDQHQYYGGTSGRSSHLDCSYPMTDDFGASTHDSAIAHFDPLSSQSTTQTSTSTHQLSTSTSLHSHSHHQNPQHHNHNQNLDSSHIGAYMPVQSHGQPQQQPHNHHNHHHTGGHLVPHSHTLQHNYHHHHHHESDASNQWAIGGHSNGPSGAQITGHGSSDSSSLDHNLVSHSLSPATHLSLDHVQFGIPLSSYQPHGGYYSHQQADQLDSFQTDEYGTSTSTLTSANSTRAQQMRQQQHSMPFDLDLGATTITNNNTSSSNTNDYHQQQLNIQQQNHHQHSGHQLYHSGQQIHQVQQHQVMEGYGGNSQQARQDHQHHPGHHQNLDHQQQQQMMPLISGGIDGSNPVILQDINLASATWGSSPEDLYGI